ncbi:MAG: 2-hydroxyacyl-CoA dehydratase family protein, partial [Pseudomonadota bacterium]
MKNGDRIETLGLLNDISAKYWVDAKMAHQNNKKIAYVNATFPVEVLYAMDVIPVYPENHSVAIEARKQSVELTQVAEAAGYPMGMCSYALCDIGSVLSGKSPIGGLPKPDFLVHCNAQCDHITKWFEVLSRHYDVPFFLLDGVYLKDELDKDSVDYFNVQLQDLMVFLEEQTGNPFDIDRLREVLAISQRTCDFWNAIMGSAANVPAPLTFFDQLIAMAPIVTQRGTKVAMEYYEKLKAEIDERVRNKIASIPGERFRLYWDNLPVWYKLRGLSEFLASYKACVVTALYTDTWGYNFDATDPLRTLAENYLPLYINMG